jgi:tetratricopeptide (TPR) repeat protein
MELHSQNSGSDNLFKTAEKDKQKADEEIKTCPIFFKCQPDYERAIPYYKSAADGFHALKNFKDEIYCRNQLVTCFQKLKSFWEEGNTLEKIAHIQLKELNDAPLAYQTISNAHNAYYAKGDYHEACNCMSKLALEFKELSNLEYCEKTLKLSFNSILKFGHVVISKDEQADYIYKCFNSYSGILFANDKTRLVIENADLFIKSIENYEKNKSEIMIIYYIQTIAKIINENNEDEIEEGFKKCEACVEDRGDISKIDALRRVKRAFEISDSKLIEDNLYEVGSQLDNEIVKKLRNSYAKILKENLEKQHNEDKHADDGNNTDDYL